MYTQSKVENSVDSSPQSDENDSHYGTPGTRLTEFSPEDLRNDQKSRSCTDMQNPQPPAFALKANSNPLCSLFKVGKPSGSDPFTSVKQRSQSGRTDSSQRLSAKAASFKPLTFSVTSASHGCPDARTAPNVVGKAQSATFHNPTFSHINASYTGHTGHNSRYDQTSSEASCVGGILLPLNTLPFQGSQPVKSPSPMSPNYNFSNGGKTRYLQINGVSRALGIDKMNHAFKGITFGLPDIVVVSRLSQGVVLLSFCDARDAWKASLELPRTQAGWAVEFIQPRDFMQVFSPNDESITSNCEGQLAVSATFQGSKESFDANYVTVLLNDLLGAYGDVLAQKILYKAFPTVRVRIEYFDLRVSSRVKRLDSLSVGEILISVEDFAPDLGWSRTNSAHSDEPLIIGQDEDELETLVGGMTRSSISGQPSPTRVSELASPFKQHSQNSAECHRSEMVPFPFGSIASFPHPQILSTPVHQPTLNPLASLSSASLRVTPISSPTDPMRTCISPTYERRRRIAGTGLNNNNNKVDMEKIRRGGDVRTTIMLRNIPNKMDQATLKEIVDETNRGEYDFMYLRIDFANNCNVGYAFINFVDPLAIIPFYQARAGRRWNKYKSHKEAEVSYATIQGRDCLVQKFRNSSVMLEHPSFRPKVFHTGLGPLAGEEDAFPDPDNNSKMRRSIENAGQVGLFAPRAGQQFRDEQRRRRSQFDRGTRLAEMEDFCHLEHRHAPQYASASVALHTNPDTAFFMQANPHII